MVARQSSKTRKVVLALKRRVKMKNLQEIIQAHTTEDEGKTKVNWEGVEAKVNEHINAIVVKSTQKESEKAVKELFEKAGLENIGDAEGLKKHIDTVSQSTEQIQKELKAKEEEIQTYLKKTEELEQKYTHVEREKTLVAAGITDPDTIDYLLFNVGKRVNEETPFEQALQAYAEEKPALFRTTATTTGTKVQKVPAGEKAGFEKILEDKYGAELFEKK